MGTTVIGRQTDNRSARLPFPASTAINVGDLLYWDTSALVANAAGNRADQGSLIANQRDFAANFIGVANDMRLSTETTTGIGSERVVSLDEICDYACPSQAWEVGDLVGIDRNAGVPANYSQQVTKVTNPLLAIGSCAIRTRGVSVTVVTVRVTTNSPFLDGPRSLFPAIGKTATVLADATATLTYGTASFISMVPTAGRSLTLPLETLGAGTVFYFTNNSAGANSVTFLGSAGGSIKGNGVVPQNKTAIIWCDGLNWSGLVSA